LFSLRTTRLSPSLEGLNNSLAQSAGKLWLGWKTLHVSIYRGRIFTKFWFYSHNFGSRYASK